MDEDQNTDVDEIDDLILDEGDLEAEEEDPEEDFGDSDPEEAPPLDEDADPPPPLDEDAAPPAQTAPARAPYSGDDQEEIIRDQAIQGMIAAGLEEDMAEALAAVIVSTAERIAGVTTGSLVTASGTYGQIAAQFPDYSREMQGRIFSNLQNLPPSQRGTTKGMNLAFAQALLQESEEGNVLITDVMLKHAAKMQPKASEAPKAQLAARKPVTVAAKAARVPASAASAPKGASTKKSGDLVIDQLTKLGY